MDCTNVPEGFNPTNVWEKDWTGKIKGFSKIVIDILVTEKKIHTIAHLCEKNEHTRSKKSVESQ